MLVGDLLNDLVQLLYISDIDAAVGERGAQLGLGALLDPREVGGGRFEAVEGVDFPSSIWLAIDSRLEKRERYQLHQLLAVLRLAQVLDLELRQIQ
jgi:hypothetical protein